MEQSAKEKVLCRQVLGQQKFKYIQEKGREGNLDFRID